MKYSFYINGIDCAHCAEKIIKEIQALPEIENATFNFSTGKLVWYSSVDSVEKITKIIKNHEPEAELSTVHKSEKNNKLYIKVILSIVFVVIGIIIPYRQSIIFFLCAYFIVGWKTIKATFSAIKSGNLFDEKFLMTVASAGAIFIGEYIEAIAVMLLYAIGESLQDRAVDKSRREINSLLSEPFDLARFLKNGELVTDRAEKAEIGDIIIVKPGEKVSLDGVIIQGTSDINTSSLTGEALPKTVGVGDNIMSGCINLNGVLHISVTELFKNSTANKIRNLIENVSEKKSKTENLITRFAKIYTPCVLIIAVLIIFVSTATGLGTFTDAFKKALTLLVISCPCAVVISVPLCYFAGIGKASSEGILIKGGNYLDSLSKADSFIFDKTGTLTTGEFTVKDIVSYGELSQEEILYYIAMAECYSTHPIAVSILKEYKGDIDKKKILGYKELSGMGISCTIDGKKILAGNRKLFENTEISGSDMTTVYLSIDGVLHGHITLGDTVRNGAETLISSLNNVYMLTGDNKKTAEKTAEMLGIKNVFAELLPPDKVEKVEEISRNSKATVFVGDGINDAPSLVGADVGIVMGGVGSDAAIEAADVVIMNDDLGKISVAVKISRFTRKIMLQCISVSLGIKFLIMLLAVSGFSNMYFAIFADVGVCLLAILNSLRILRI